MLNRPRVGDVIRFWFEELVEDDWFSKSDAIDAQIRDRFLLLHEQLVAKDGPCVTAPRPLLAAIIVLDQFSRHLFRDTSRAFASDSIARRFARMVIEKGFDAVMRKQERLFLYLPFQHSEDGEDQGCRFTFSSNLVMRNGERAMPWPTRRSSIDSAAFHTVMPL